MKAAFSYLLGNVEHSRRLWREFLTAYRFGLIGTVSTLVHLLTVSVLLGSTQAPPLVANTFAFMIAFCFSFIGNYLWTFRSSASPASTAVRFMAVSLTGFIFNTITLHTLIAVDLTSQQTSAMFSAATVPAISYAGSRLWAFRDRRNKN